MCPGMDLNHRPIDFQSIASTAELPGHSLSSNCPHRTEGTYSYTTKSSRSETVAKIPTGEVGIEIEL